MAKKAVKKKKTVVKKGTQQRIEPAMKNEFVSLFIVVAALLLGVFLYIPGDMIVSTWFHDLFTGLMGLPVYVLPIFLLVFGIHRAVGKGYEEHKHQYLQVFLMILVLSSLCQLFSGTGAMNPLRLSSLSAYWWAGTSGYGGGVLGGVLCDVFANTMGAIPAGII